MSVKKNYNNILGSDPQKYLIFPRLRFIEKYKCCHSNCLPRINDNNVFFLYSFEVSSLMLRTKGTEYEHRGSFRKTVNSAYVVAKQQRVIVLFNCDRLCY